METQVSLKYRRMKKIYLLSLILLSTSFMFAASQNEVTGFSEGEGTADNPWIISSLDELNYFSSQVNAGTSYTGAFFKLKLTINTGGKATPFIPIGGNGSSSLFFDGTFDGNGRTIADLYIDQEEGMYIGLFGVLGSNAVVKNLGITGNSAVKALGYVGAIAGKNLGKIENCFNYATVTANSNVGGIAGTSEGEVTKCYNIGAINAVKTTSAGGIVGYNTAKISESYNIGTISAKTNNAGGVAGTSTPTGEITTCFNSGIIKGANNVGGITGYMMGASRIGNSYSSGQIFITNPSNTAIGGVIGRKEGTAQLTNCYYDGQMCDAGGAMNELTAGVTKLTTRAMTVNTPFAGFDLDKWSFETGLYPLLKAFPVTTDVAKTAATPVVLDENDTFCSVTKGFKLNIGKLTAWSSNSTALRVGNDTVRLFPAADADIECILSAKAYPGTTFSRQYYLYVAKGTPAGLFGGGDGSESNPYLIQSQDHLAQLSADVNEGFSYTGLYFKLENDLDLKGNWTPVGTKINSKERPFDGSFEGNHHSISNLNVQKDTDGAGLFGFTGPNSTIRNLTISSGKIELTGAYKYYAAGIAGSNQGRIENCVNHASVSGCNYTAGIAGSSRGDIIQCSNTGMIMGMENTAGIAGGNNGNTSFCHNTGNVVGSEYTGGIVGVCDGGSIKDCYNTGNVIMTTCPRDYSKVGGVCGYLTSTMERCYNTGTVMVNSENDKVRHYSGGLLGKCYNGKIKDCYNTGAVYAVTGNAGGLVGISSGDQTSITSCYNIGTEKSDFMNGANETIAELSGAGTYTNLLYDKQVASIGNGSNGTGLLTKDLATISGIDGFDADTWLFAEGQYPRLKGMENVPQAILAASAITLYVKDDQTSWDSQSLITHDFKVSNANGVVWSAPENPVIRLDGENGIVTIPKENDYQVKLTATLGDLKKETDLNVMVKINGSGTTEDPWLIETPELLKYLSNKVNAGEPYVERYFKQTTDLDLGADDLAFLPIGGNGLSNNQFRGVYDGDNHSISNLVIDQAESNYVGLFGYVGLGGIVKNIRITGDCTINGGGYTGGIVGECSGTVENCSSAATVSGITCAGGIVGWTNNTAAIRNCFNAGPVTASSTNSAGGIVGGHTSSELTACFNTGTISAAQKQAGGIAGYSSGSITHCFNSGTVSSPLAVGGIAGRISSSGSSESLSAIKDCYNSGVCLATDNTAIGGIVGVLDNPENDIAGNYYDRQSVDKGGCGGTDMEGKAEGYLTQAMTQSPIPLNAEIWEFPGGLYPVLKAFATEPAALVAIAPVNLYADGTDYETAGNIARDFTMSTGNGVTWSTDTENLRIENGQARILKPQGDLNFTLRATLNGFTKELKMKLSQLTPVDQTEDADIRVYADGSCIRIETPVPASIEIIGSDGKRSACSEINGNKSFTGYPAGMYLVRTVLNGKTKVHRVIIR